MRIGAVGLKKDTQLPMPRPLRIWFPGALYHLVVRGDNREPIFFAEQDYHKYLQLLQVAKRRYGAHLFAYALMTNHVHLMVQTDQTYPVSKLMQSLNTAYTMYINKAYKRVGHVFQGRYHSVLVEKDAYALELTRYIHLNPVRAGLVRAPEQYPWSSYHAYLGRGGNRLVEPEEILAMVSPVESRRRMLYTQFVIDGLMTQPLQDREILANRIVGSPDFVSRVQAPRAELRVRPSARGVVPRV